MGFDLLFYPVGHVPFHITVEFVAQNFRFADGGEIGGFRVPSHGGILPGIARYAYRVSLFPHPARVDAVVIVGTQYDAVGLGVDFIDWER